MRYQALLSSSWMLCILVVSASKGYQWDDRLTTSNPYECPEKSPVYQANFNFHEAVFLGPTLSKQGEPSWQVRLDGSEIAQTKDCDPGVALLQGMFSSVDFEGTFFVDTTLDDDYIGIVFGYQSNRAFYAVMWKKLAQSYMRDRFMVTGEPGILIKFVNSTTGPGEALSHGLWHTYDVSNQTRTLWYDEANYVPWAEKKPYRWLLKHRPAGGLIRLKIFDGDKLIIDSGNVYDSALDGGRLGVLDFSQINVIWSNVTYQCNDDQWDLYTCPANSPVYQANFNNYEAVFLGPALYKQEIPKWEVRLDGSEIAEIANCDPGIALLEGSFTSVDFEGSISVGTNKDDDFIGFVFSYQSDHAFYVVMWKKFSQSLMRDRFMLVAEQGLHIKLIDSTTGPGQALDNALWHTYTTTNQSKTLWYDESFYVPWAEKISYRWVLNHRPAIGLIRVKIFDGNNLIIDSGNVYDKTLRGGRLGVFDYSQDKVSWSNVNYQCNEDVTDEIWQQLPPEKQRILESRGNSH